MKRIWLVKIGETLPLGTNQKRLLRTGLIASILAKDGNDVTFWSSTFDHFNKKHHFSADTEIITEEGYCLRMLYGRKYYKNVSIDRVINHSQIAKKFKEQIFKEQNKPDIIVCSFPTIELAYECVKFGKKLGIPVLLDIRDLWPDIFFQELLPSPLKKIVLAGFNKLFRKHSYALKNASGLIGITKNILLWGLNYADRVQGPSDYVFHLSYNRILSECNLDALKRLEQKNIIFETEKMYVCLIGTISSFKFDFDPIIKAAELLEQNKSNVEFLICGDGENLNELKNKCAALKNINFTGWIDQEEINCIMLKSSVGLAPYRNTFTYLTSIPSKISEYFSYGLTVLSGLGGDLKEYIEENNAGWYYDSETTLFKYLNTLAENKDVLDSFGTNNLRLFEQNFKSSIVYDKFKNIILENSNSNLNN